MSKEKYSWTKTTNDDRVGILKFSIGSFYTGDVDIHDLRMSRYPKRGLPLTTEEWEKVNKGETVTKEYTYKKIFTIRKEEDDTNR